MAKREDKALGIEEKVEAFNYGIDQIEKRHAAFFGPQASPKNTRAGNYLSHYFALDYNSSRARITFTDATLPAPIRVEVEELFDKVWS